MATDTLSIFDSPLAGKGVVTHSALRAGSIFLVEEALTYVNGNASMLIAACEDRWSLAELSTMHMNGATIARVVGRYMHRLNTQTGLCTGLALYKVGSLINHSCDPNAAMFFKGDGQCHLVATRDCAPGEEVTISYCINHSCLPVVTRRGLIGTGDEKFWCRCSRCEAEHIARPFEQQAQYTWPTLLSSAPGERREKIITLFMSRTANETWATDYPAVQTLQVITAAYRLRSCLSLHEFDSKVRVGWE
jgi:hypothetical protein